MKKHEISEEQIIDLFASAEHFYLQLRDEKYLGSNNPTSSKLWLENVLYGIKRAIHVIGLDDQLDEYLKNS